MFMLDMSTSYETLLRFLLALLGGTVLVYLLRLWLLPRPIPGIPYNNAAVKSILGDILEADREIQRTGEISGYLRGQAQRFNAPIFQLFMRPFAKPWVVIADFRETQDIVARRSREFDRSNVFGDLFSAVLPGSMVHMATGDVWRSQRKLVGDTMNPTFLNDVAGPRIYEATEALVRLWSEKGKLHINDSKLAQGHTTDVKEDIFNSALDGIWAATFGSVVGTTQTQADLLSTIDKIEKPASDDESLVFPKAAHPKAFESIIALGDSCTIPMRSLIPRLHHRLALRFVPSIAAARKHKDDLISEQLQKAVKKFADHSAQESDVRCALDLTVARESVRARKEERDMDFESKYVKDELFAFLMAGHETTATTVSWGLKLLTTHQHIQHKLRQVLYDAFPEHRKNKTMPSAPELTKTKIPYLDATLEEIHRKSGTSAAIFRVTTTETVIMGHVIPKGTDVCCLTNGASFVDVPIHIDESIRSQTSRESKDKNGAWDPSTIKEFLPDRWLFVNNAGETEFDPRAGPTMPFGGGPRGCFGRRLAEVELKLLLCMIIWSFKLSPTPAALSKYDSKDVITHAPKNCYVRLSNALTE